MLNLAIQLLLSLTRTDLAANSSQSVIARLSFQPDPSSRRRKVRPLPPARSRSGQLSPNLKVLRANSAASDAPSQVLSRHVPSLGRSRVRHQDGWKDAHGQPGTRPPADMQARRPRILLVRAFRGASHPGADRARAQVCGVAACAAGTGAGGALRWSGRVTGPAVARGVARSCRARERPRDRARHLPRMAAQPAARLREGDAPQAGWGQG